MINIPNIDLLLYIINYIFLLPQLFLIVQSLILLLWHFWSNTSIKFTVVNIHKKKEKININIIIIIIAQILFWYNIMLKNINNKLLISFSPSSLPLLSTYSRTMEEDTYNFFYSVDSLSIFFNSLIFFFTFIIMLLCINYIKVNQILFPISLSIEFFILFLFSIIGMSFIIISFDFLFLYVSLEIFTLTLFCLASIRQTLYSIESGLKYFILGSWTSCVYLLGVSLIYLIIPTTNFLDIINVNYFILNFEWNLFYDTTWIYKNLIYYDLSFILNKVIIFNYGSFFIFISLISKLGAAPFHLWLIDVYENAPNPVTAFFAIVTKIPLWVVLLKLKTVIFYTISYILMLPILLIIISSLLIGSIGMYNQSSLKRIFAYSSINHVGLMLMALVSEIGYHSNFSIIFHLILYSISLLGIFSILINLIPFRFLDFKINSKNNETMYLNDYSGLYIYNKYLSFCFIFLLFSLAGLPPFSGFFSKYMLLSAALESNHGIIIIFFAILSTIISCYKYLQIIKIILFDNLSQVSFFPFDLISSFILVSSFITSSFFIYPEFFNFYYIIISNLLLH